MAIPTSTAAAPPAPTLVSIATATATAYERLAAAWPRILDRLDQPEQAQGVKLFLRSAKVAPVACVDGTLTVDCPTAIYQDQIRKRFAESLAAAATEVLGEPVREIACRVTGPSAREHERRVVAAGGDNRGAGTSAPVDARRPVSPISSGKALDAFQVGSCNRLAYDAVMQVLEHPRRAPNPLFIHGAPGLGKTHLEQGLARAFKERYPGAKVEYLRCEQFYRELMAATADGGDAVRAFEVRMRHPDLLLIDDLHFLGRGQKSATKDQLLQTFESLADHGKLMVLTSDAPPRDIQYLESRFIQRVSGGLVVELHRPDPDVRRSILAQLLRDRELHHDDAVVHYVAEHLVDNVRELEGAVHRLAQHVRTFGGRIDLPAARGALADLLAGRDEPPEQVVLAAVAARYALAPAVLIGRSRAGSRPLARQVAMYILKHAGSATYAEIGKAVGISSHGTVAHACEAIGRRRPQDADLDRFIAETLARLARAR
jgi:chromosomal replication initiator protein